MKRNLWLNAALAAIVVVLGAWIYFKPARDAPAEFPLSALKAPQAGSIRIERPGAPPILLEKRDGSWHVTAPFAARADDLKVQRLLEIAEARATHKLPATDLARFELERPQARLFIDGQEFAFGMVGAVAREQYVLAGQTVYTVHPRYGAALPASSGELASRQLLAAGESPVRIEQTDFTVEQRDGRWTLAPAAGELSQDDFIRWIENWQLASATRVEPFVKGKPLAEIRLRLKDGRAIALGILAREPELVLARPDEELQYYFRPELAQRLLTPPGTMPVERKEKK
jgi:hypothetical protein